MHLGKEVGNIMNVDLKDLDLPVDLLCAGPPCPPWAGQGCGRGALDRRADVFKQVVKWAVYLAKRGGLLAAVLENVIGCNRGRSGQGSYMQRVQETLAVTVPEFSWEICTLRTDDYKLA